VIALADLELRERVSYSHRVSLALIIAYAFLELGNTPWLPYTTGHINIWLPHLAGSAPDLLHPYIEVGLDQDSLGIDSALYNFAYMVNPNMPCLPLLGKLIFELISGDPIEILDVNMHVKRYCLLYPERAPHVSSAVLSCFHDFRTGKINEDEGLKTAFLNRVIQRLHNLLRFCPERNLKKVFLNARPRTAPQSSPGANGKNSFHAGGQRDEFSSSPPQNPTSTHCLHDDGSAGNYDETQ
jgi:hypothetical protein